VFGEAVNGVALERRTLRGVSGAERLTCLYDWLASSYVRCEVRATEVPAASLEGVLVRGSVGDIALVDVTCSPCAGRRGRRELEGADADRVGIHLVRGGREAITNGAERIVLEAGDVMVWDGARPLEFEAAERLTKRTLVLPRERALALCPELGPVLGTSLPSGTALSRLLGSYLESLGREWPALDAHGRRAAAGAALELLRGALAPRIAGGRETVRATLRAHIRGYVEEHLGDPGLGPAEIAREHAVSVRALHALFEETGESVGALIRRRRLERCREELERTSGGSITEIAHRFGFRDSAHFSRAFRRHYGCAPRDVRLASALGSKQPCTQGQVRALDAA
jgi:AraC-like DNA-binding protein